LKRACQLADSLRPRRISDLVAFCVFLTCVGFTGERAVGHTGEQAFRAIRMADLS